MFRRLLFGAGVLGALAGGVLLVLGATHYLDSTVPDLPPRPLALDYSGDPGGIYDLPGASLAATPTPAPVQPPLREAPYRLLIQRIGVDAGVFTYGLDENGVPQVPLNAWDVAWYNFSAKPGTGGNAVFAAHVTWNGRAVFYDLHQLQPGDGIVLRGEDGTELLYTVSESFQVDPADPNSLAVMGPTDSDVLTLITCDGQFFYTGDPVFNGDYTNRRVVRAALSSVLTPPPPAGVVAPG